MEEYVLHTSDFEADVSRFLFVTQHQNFQMHHFKRSMWLLLSFEHDSHWQVFLDTDMMAVL